MDVSQTTRVVRRVMLHLCRRGADRRARAARRASAKRASGADENRRAGVFAQTRRPRAPRRDARGRRGGAPRAIPRVAKTGCCVAVHKKKKKKKTCSSRRARFDRARAGGRRRQSIAVRARPSRDALHDALPDARSETTPAGTDRRAVRASVRGRPTRRLPRRRRREKQNNPRERRSRRKKKSAASSPRLVRARASSLEGHETVFRRGKRTLERSSARPPPARADASLGVSFAPRDGALGGRARARRRVGEGVATRRARTNKINPRRRRGRAPSLAVTGSAWAPRFAAGVSSFGAWVRTGGSGVSAARPWGWDGGNARRRRRRRWSNDGERWRKIARGRLRRRRGRTGGAVDAVAGAVALGASDFTSDGGFASKSARVRGVGMSGTAENRASRRVVETREAA